MSSSLWNVKKSCFQSVCVCFLWNKLSYINNLQASVIAALPSVSVCVIKISDISPWYNEPNPEYQCKTECVSEWKENKCTEQKWKKRLKDEGRKCKWRRIKQFLVLWFIYSGEALGPMGWVLPRTGKGAKRVSRGTWLLKFHSLTERKALCKISQVDLVTFVTK